MLEATSKITIEAACEKVFRFYCDHDAWVAALPGFVDVDMRTPPPFKFGTRWSQRRRNRLLCLEAVEADVVAFDPPLRIELGIAPANGSGVSGALRSILELAPVESETIVSLTARWDRPPFPEGLIQGWVSQRIQVSAQRDLAAMKAYIESNRHR